MCYDTAVKKLFLTESPTNDYEIYQSQLFKKALAMPPIMPGSMADASRVSAHYVSKVAAVLETILVEMEGLSVRESLGFYARNPLYTTQIRDKAQFIINSWSERIEGLGDKVSGEQVVEWILSVRR